MTPAPPDRLPPLPRGRSIVARRPWSMSTLLAIAAFTTGTLWGTLSDWPAERFADAKRTVREALGLPKFWVELGGWRPEARARIACPDPSRTIALVTGGQSNAANSISARTVTKPGDQVYTWFEGHCYVTRDPLLGATGDRGSIWAMLAWRLAKASGRPVMLINGAVGGTQVSDWLDPRSGYYEALKGRVDGAVAAGYKPDLILWHQGETDAAVELDSRQFERELMQLSGRLLADNPGVPLYLFAASRCKDGRNDEIIAAQRRVALRSPRIIAGLDTDILPSDARWDGCHFNSLGRQLIVERVANAILKLV